MKIMDNVKGKSRCANCGYLSDGRFKGDICPRCGLAYWSCSNCGFLISAKNPPDTCPQCNEMCAFMNVTCYTPECGGEGKLDPRLLRGPK
jgi:rubrerythrin